MKRHAFFVVFHLKKKCKMLNNMLFFREKQDGQVSPRNFMSDSCPPLSPNENSA